MHRRGDAGTIRPTCAPSGDAGATLSGSANLDVLAPDSTLREEFEQWRLREDHFGGATSPDMLQQTSRLAGRTQNPPPRAAPAQSKRRRWTLQRDGNHSAVGRRRRATLRSGAPPSRRRLITEKDGIASIGPHVLGEGAARRHGSDRSCSAGPPCARAPWAGSKQALEDET